MKKNIIKKIILIILIIILSCFIILPPLLRITIADVNLTGKTNNENKNSDLLILSCEKYDSLTSTLITSRTRYKDNVPDQNFITYEKTIRNKDLTSEIPSYKTASEEIDFFSKINGIEITETDTKTTVLISKYVVDMNQANFTLAKYFSSKDTQREFYEGQGYKCEETKN